MSKLKSLILGKVKDKASIGKANLVHSFSSKSVRYIHLALLKSTTHTSNKRPNSDYVSAVLSYSDSRYGPAAFTATLWRLRVTKNAFVATKTLIVLHKLIKASKNKFQGQDRGSNNLKLNDFSDNSSNLTLELSQWVRWYGLYLDRLSWLSMVLGDFPSLIECSKEKAKEKDCVTSHQTGYVMRQTDSIVSFFEDICSRPVTPPLHQNKIVDEIRELLIQDYFTVVRLLMVRLQVLRERMIKPGFDDSGLNDMRSILVRLEECKESLSGFFWCCRRLAEDFWCLVELMMAETVKDDMEMLQTMVEDGEKMVELTSLVQTEWVTFDDYAIVLDTATDEVEKWNSEWVTFDDSAVFLDTATDEVENGKSEWVTFDDSEGTTNESVWFSLYT